ncbi:MULTISPECIES: hypothetical protein [Pseudomonas]|jgi:hypothetical protein|uniref:Uncharacterized protein n=1 Tax=Pseudomonas kilonensis TaxID=132476 RepID=A0ABY0ZHI9_9PSED|nr:MULTISPECIES: hypothetical protein [Pseudomonas]EPJ77580.1 hypothetical protein CFII68_24214 [Pseudomonas sp. CFII68]MCP1455955.1 hypothetical protein [Pseudomonas kilonensis]UVM64011.1 hypothetical protein LOY50_13550 [Pseudomonas sp. B21-010]WPN66102.1 hypothetical protein QMK48_13375 [Pseudomonas sp. P9_32]WPN66485.1 hypothetical protein QMK47_14285 [Pseudomonas sp. P9_35]
MPVVLHQFTVAMGGVMNPGYLEALELARQCATHAHTQALPGAGIAHGSCWAALATVSNPGAGFPLGNAVAGGAALPYGVVFGNSRFSIVGAFAVVPGAPAVGFSGHAERNALVVAGGNGLVPYGLVAPNAGDWVMYVQLHPCQYCLPWLQGAGGGGLLNPFAGLIAGAQNLHVWYRWAHNPVGCAAKDTWNGLPLATKLAQINTW